jgi:hypothetical protein
MTVDNRPIASLDDWTYWLRNNARLPMSPEAAFRMMDTFVWSWLRSKGGLHEH